MPFSPSHRQLIEMVLDNRLALASREKQPILLNAHELVHLKLLAISVSKELAQNWHTEKKQLHSYEQLQKIGKLLLTVTQKPKLSDLLEIRKNKASSKGTTNTQAKEKTKDQIISPLNMITNRSKRVGVLGNYCQILLPVCNPIKKKQKQLGHLSLDEFELRKSLINGLADSSDYYVDLKGRDLSDVVKAIVLVKL